MISAHKRIRNPMSISRCHPNRRAFNWLAYDINDMFLQSNVSCFSGTIYDLGAGEAPYRDFFLKHAKEYIAVDWGSSLHEPKVDILADLNKPLPIADCAADCVVSLQVLEHLCEPAVMISEAIRILKPGGALVLTVPWQWRVHEEPFDFFRFTPYALRYLLQRAGFINIEIRPSSGFFTTVLLKLNYFSLELIRGPRVLRRLLSAVSKAFWYVAQRAAPVLDKLDKNWEREAAWYFVTAKKP